MRRSFGLVTSGLLLLTFPAVGQQLEPGKYSGRVEYIAAGTARSQMVSLTVEKVEGDRFEGIAWVGTANCGVDVPVRGKWEGDTLKVRGKADKGCGIGWDLKRAGDALEGKTSGGNSIRISK
jgi:hypothetical protein